MNRGEDALAGLADVLRREDSVISAYVTDPDDQPALGKLAAAGPRAGAAPDEYALVIESVREGYLLHYAGGRIVAGVDPDLALLAGDYLYALGLERLAALGDLAAVCELSDLISLAAQVHDGGRPTDRALREASALWLACATAIAAGASPAYVTAKTALRAGSGAAAASLFAGAHRAAASAGIESELEAAADSIDFETKPLS